MSLSCKTGSHDFQGEQTFFDFSKVFLGHRDRASFLLHLTKIDEVRNFVTAEV